MFRLWIRRQSYTNVKFPSFGYYNMAMKENVLHRKTYILKYLRVMECDVSNLL